MIPDTPRLIERAFPLKQASLDSVHEKSVRHGHISTLHIWPARRPLAACRAALIATLLPDPDTFEKRKEIMERLAGKVVQVPKTKKLANGQVKVEHKEETVGGILHWGRESGPDLEWFREEIRKAYGGRAPRVLDPFAGGGAIPLEAMRLGCQVTAIDINPVAWFILKCTLEYPQKLGGQKRPLPLFALESPEFMREYWRATGKYSKKQLDAKLAQRQTRLMDTPGADLAWHVRAWGWWVLQRAKKDLEKYYPTMGGKPTVAYLWARTVTCKNCRATIPLLKTRWLCKKDNKRVLLSMEPNKDRTGVEFDIQTDVPVMGGNAAQRREHEKRIGAGTMSKSGATCPGCSAIVTMEDMRAEGKADRLGALMTAVVVDGPNGKEYRLPTGEENQVVGAVQLSLGSAFDEIPFGMPNEPTPMPSGPRQTGSSLPLYGLNSWSDVFTPRQMVALATFVRFTREARSAMDSEGYPPDWPEAVFALLAATFDRTANQTSNISRWNNRGEKVEGTFSRFALPIVWDYAEVNPLGNTTGAYRNQAEWVSLAVSHLLAALTVAPSPVVSCRSAMEPVPQTEFDAIVTDPPYYDAIPYSDLMDFFHVWLRRLLSGASPELASVFFKTLGPKWDHNADDGELVDDPTRFDDDKTRSKQVYEEGMFRAFKVCNSMLRSSGRMIIVFANKKPEAWETLVSAVVRAGFVVDGSWPIQTEMGTRMRAMSSAALSSSVWLVCQRRPDSARPGWDNQVLEEMRSKIHQRLQEFWDAGIRGPDFVWAATGPALEAYSKHPLVKKANAPGAVMAVSEFLRHVRRIVVDFVVGRVLSRNGDGTSASGLDDLTTYYLLHRHDFGFDDTPAGACILYAVSCGLSDTGLAYDHDLLVRTGGTDRDEDEDEEVSGDEDDDAEVEEGSGSTVRLKAWNQRKRKSIGDDVNGKPAPLIDRIHRLMHLWRAGDVVKVDEYLDEHGLVRNATFHQVLQAIIELSKEGSEERNLLESLSNHVAAKGGIIKKAKAVFEYTDYPGIREGGKPE